MKNFIYSIGAFFIIFLTFSCKKEVSIFKPANLIYRDGVLSDLLDLLHTPLDGSVVFENYSYNFVGQEKYTVHGSFKDIIGIDQLFLGQEEVLSGKEFFNYSSHIPQGLQGFSTVDALNNYFGTSLPITFYLSSVQEVIDTFLLPQKLVFDINEKNPTLYPGKTITWNPNPNDVFGLFILFEYDPAANLQVPEVANHTAYTSKVIWYVYTEDDGSYTFSSSDFNQTIPAEGWAGFRAIRANIKDISIDNHPIRLAAHTEVHGMCRYYTE